MYLINEINIVKPNYTTTKQLFTNQFPILGNDNKYHYCYEIYIPSSKWYYRGVRSSDDWKKDDYIGSSSYYCYYEDINHSDKIVFNIISFHENRTSANLEETKIVDRQYVKRNDTYNLTIPNSKLTNFGRKQITNIHTGKTITVNPGDKILENQDWVSGTNFSPIEQYTLKGEFINSYNSIKLAENELNITGISQCCNNKSKSSNGFLFIFKGDTKSLNSKIEQMDFDTQRIYKFNLEGKLIHIFDNIHQIPIKYNEIKNVCLGINNQYKKFIYLTENNKDTIEKRISQKRKGKLIGKYLKGELIETYESSIIAAEQNNTSKHTIRNLCYGRKKELNGFIFSYVK